jgi:dihydropteroate synthase
MRDFTVMGVVNVTPDSFSDGGRWLDTAAAIAHGRVLWGQGAGILDVGGESTRPGAVPVEADEELRRVLPVVEQLAADGHTVSIDTSKLAVAREAVRGGARYVNDVTAFRQDPGMAALVAETGCECCLTHMLGEPRTMQEHPRYDDVVDDVKSFLAERAAFAVAEGIAPERVQVDPGIGFGKTLEHNLTLLRRLDELLTLGFPVVLGTSRKSFLGRLTGRPTDQLVPATLATQVLGLQRGASVFRVHDVEPVVQALTVAAATLAAP